MSKYISYCDAAICLTLDKRLNDTKQLVQDINKIFNLDPYLFIVGDGTASHRYDRIDNNQFPPIFPETINYNTWIKRVNPYQAFLSHKLMLQKAIDMKAKSVLFLEDDSVIHPDFHSVMNPLHNLLESQPWDMLWLGSYNANAKKKEVAQNLYKVEGECGGFHGVIIKQHMLGVLGAFPPFGPLDYMCHKYVQPHRNCWAVIPSVIVQKSGFSYVEGHHLDKKRDS